MSDTVVELPALTSAESIPAVLAASKAKRKGQRPARGDTFLGAPATFDAAPSLPTAAAPADLQPEDTTMATTIENMTETATDKTPMDKAGAMFGEMNDRAKSAMGKSAALFAEFNSFGKGNVEALVEAGKIAVAGLQTMAHDQAAYVRQQFETATTAARTMTTVKSPTEFAKLQSDYVRQQFDAMVAETSRSTEATMKLVGEVVQPISNRMALAAEKIKQAA